jgi:molecular chaperone GrpE
MTYPDNPYEQDLPVEEEISSEDAYARGASAADGDSGPGVETGPVSARAPSRDDAELERALEEQRDRYLRLAAEYDNFRKRSLKERLEAGSRAQADLVKQLIDSLDDLSRFATLDPSGTDSATVLQGVDLVEKKLRKALTAAGLEVIEPVDQPFDPASQEAVATEPALSSEDDNLVARVYQRGYMFNGQLLRPARVVVKQWNG